MVMMPNAEFANVAIIKSALNYHLFVHLHVDLRHVSLCARV